MLDKINACSQEKWTLYGCSEVIKKSEILLWQLIKGNCPIPLSGSRKYSGGHKKAPGILRFPVLFLAQQEGFEPSDGF